MNRRDCLAGLAALGTGGLLAGCAGVLPRDRHHFVLVHGAWHGAWCWEKLSPLLRAQGHRVTALDLPGHGNDRTPLEQITLASYVRTVTDFLDAQRDPVVLVGHSLGGMTVSQAAEERPDKIRTAVFLTSFVMSDGESAVASRKDPDNKVTPVLLIDFRPGTKVPLQTRLDTSKPEGLKLAFYNDCDDADVRFASGRLVAEPFAPMTEKLRLTREKFGSVDKAYVFCSRDNAITVGSQRAVAAKWPMKRTVTLDSGHSPFFSMPQRLAQALSDEVVVG